MWTKAKNQGEKSQRVLADQKAKLASKYSGNGGRPRVKARR